MKFPGGGYLQNFIKHRVGRIVIPWIIVSCLYGAYYWIIGGKEQLLDVITRKQNGFLVIQNSWFIVAIAVFYCFFYVAFKFMKVNDLVAILTVFVLCCVYCVVCYIIGLGVWWYYSSWTFSMGMLLKKYDFEINIFLKKHYYPCLLLTSFFFVMCYAIRIINSKCIHFEFIYILCGLIASALFSCLMVEVSSKISFSNKIWSFLGDISIEIYLIHELVFTILRSSWVYVISDGLYVILTIMISIGLAYALHMVFGRLFKIMKI